MSTPHEVACDPRSMASITAAYVADFLKSSAEVAERASKTSEGGTVYAYGYLQAAVEQAIRMLDQERVSDAEADAVADAACGAPVDSHVSRTYVGPGPERLKARFRW